jgi:hypothetical protein
MLLDKFWWKYLSRYLYILRVSLNNFFDTDVPDGARKTIFFV